MGRGVQKILRNFQEIAQQFENSKNQKSISKYNVQAQNDYLFHYFLTKSRIRNRRDETKCFLFERVEFLTVGELLGVDEKGILAQRHIGKLDLGDAREPVVDERQPLDPGEPAWEGMGGVAGREKRQIVGIRIEKFHSSAKLTIRYASKPTKETNISSTLM